jgi:PiT family inorganic phosphate transporter
MSGGIMGAGAAKRLSAVRWGVAGNIAVAWVLTLPAAAAVGALTFGVVYLFGENSAGPVVVSAVLVGLLVAAFARRARAQAAAERQAADPTRGLAMEA